MSDLPQTTFHQVEIKVGQREQMPMMLYENVAEGELETKNGKEKVIVNRSVGGKLLMIAMGDRNYVVDLFDIVNGIAEHEKQQ